MTWRACLAPRHLLAEDLTYTLRERHVASTRQACQPCFDGAMSGDLQCLEDGVAGSELTASLAQQQLLRNRCRMTFTASNYTTAPHTRYLICGLDNEAVSRGGAYGDHSESRPRNAITHEPHFLCLPVMES